MWVQPVLIRIDYNDGKTDLLQTSTEGNTVYASALFGGTVHGVYLIDGNGEAWDVELDEDVIEPGRRFSIEVED